MYYKEGGAREEVVAIIIASHAACLLLGGSIGFLLAAVCAMASDKYPQAHSPDQRRCECGGPATEDPRSCQLPRGR
jgi:hypothetical protein